MAKKIAETEALAVSPTIFTENPWWSKLNEQEQQVILAEGQGLAGALLTMGRSKLAIGKHLTNIQATLAPHNVWLKFLRVYHFPVRTAQHFIAGYKNALAAIPEPILKEAMARGMNIIGDTEDKPLGTYTAAVAALPPPPTPTPAQVVTYLEQLENVRRQTKHGAETPTSLVIKPADLGLATKVLYKTFSHWLRRLPTDRSGKIKMKFLSTVVGMFLAEAGITSQQTFGPQAIPAEFRIGRGRPRLTAATPE
jgi:hypothetical protein